MYAPGASRPLRVVPFLSVVTELAVAPRGSPVAPSQAAPHVGGDDRLNPENNAAVGLFCQKGGWGGELKCQQGGALSFPPTKTTRQNR